MELGGAGPRGRELGTEVPALERTAQLGLQAALEAFDQALRRSGRRRPRHRGGVIMRRGAGPRLHPRQQRWPRPSSAAAARQRAGRRPRGTRPPPAGPHGRARRSRNGIPNARVATPPRGEPDIHRLQALTRALVGVRDEPLLAAGECRPASVGLAVGEPGHGWFATRRASSGWPQRVSHAAEPSPWGRARAGSSAASSLSTS